MNFNHIKTIHVFLIGLISLIVAQNRTPDFRLHDRGEIWDTMNDDGTHGSHPLKLGDYYPSMDPLRAHFDIKLNLYHNQIIFLKSNTKN